MPYYDAVRPMVEAGSAETITEFQDVQLDPYAAAFSARLPDAPPPRIERSINLITLDHVTIFGSTGAVVDEARGEVLRLHGGRSFTTYQDFRPVLSAVVEKPDAIYFNMVGLHKGNRHYYHFTFDRLPRLYYFLKRFELGEKPITVLTNVGLPQFQRDIYRFIGQRFPNVRFEAVPHQERWRLPRLYQVDDYQPVMRTVVSPDLVAFMRALVFDGFGIHPEVNGKRRIYVSRGDTPKRRITNEKEILPLLTRHGFEVIAPGKLSFRDQVALFSSAEIIAGAHGAGLTNLLYAPRSAKVLEIFPASKLNSIYLLLAHSLGQTYRAVVGGPGGRREWFKVDASEMAGALEALIATPPNPASA